MKNKELFEKSIGILVNAYMNDTLVKMNCFGCAVGNLIATNMGIKMIKILPLKYKSDYLAWEGYRNYNDFRENYLTGNGMCDKDIWMNAIQWGTADKSKVTPKMQKHIDSTGYTLEELALIEDCFEKSDDVFEGLMNVVELLCKLHECEEELNNKKLLFVK